MVVRMEIICVGNELLIGKTLNTNAHWLAKRATTLGLIVNRITVVRDDVEDISAVVSDALKRRPRFLVTTGGLGPTFDDKTLEGIAKALKRQLGVNEEAMRRVREKYETYLKEGKIAKVELTPSRIKMATFPEETQPLHNPVGTAPGMLARVNETFLIALPGVPPEMEAIFDESLIAMMKKEAGRSAFFEKSILAENVMESNLAPLIDRVMHDNPHVYIKSHVYTKSNAHAAEGKPHIELHFSATANNPKAAMDWLDKAIAQLTELVQNSGGKVRVQ